MYKILVLLLIGFATTAQAQAETVTLVCKGTFSSIGADGSPIADPIPTRWRLTLDLAAGIVTLERFPESQIDAASGSSINFSEIVHKGPKGSIDLVTGNTWVETVGFKDLINRREGTCRPVQGLF